MSHIDGSELEGFTEPVTIAQLRSERYKSIPAKPGIYFIIRATDSAHPRVPGSTGGWFKGKDPAYPFSVVEANWVEGASVVYVGMAAGKKGLRGRLCQFFDFGDGKPVGHRGGRLLWHLQESGDLLVRWRICGAEEAYANETAAIASFRNAHEGKRPYANMAK